MNLSDQLEDVLLENGVTPTRPLLDSLNEIAEDEALRLAGESVRHLLLKVDGTPAGIALRRVVLGEECSLREEARRVGVTHQAILRHEKAIRRKLELPPALMGRDIL